MIKPNNEVKKFIYILIICSSSMKIYAQQDVTVALNSSKTCNVFSSNTERLACYDKLFDYSPITSIENESEATLPNFQNNDKTKSPIDIQATIQSKTPLLDKRWELTDENHVGLWILRPYQPVYLLPTFWTSDLNQYPTSENPRNNVVGQHQIDSTEAKFQLSMKTKLRDNLFGDNGDLWLGYTQKSYWQVYNDKDSRPFRTINYEPEMSLIFRTNYELLGLNWRLFGITFNHESNGSAIPYSRNWNRVMMNFGFERENFVLTVRPWVRVLKKDNVKDDNPDITNYLGHGDMTAYYKWGKQSFSLMGRHNVSTGYGAAQFSWDFPLRNNLNGYLQVFHGYGENLIDYNHKATYVGLGISLINAF